MNAQRKRRAGFTLLELLVVMALIALAMGMVAPAASRWIAAVRERGWHDDLRTALAALPLQTFHQGAALSLDAEAIRALVPELPADVGLKLSAPLRYAPNGSAQGGTVSVIRPDGSIGEVWTVAPLTGRVTP